VRRARPAPSSALRSPAIGSNRQELTRTLLASSRLIPQLTQGARPLTHSSLTPSSSRFVLPPPLPNTKLNTGLAKSTVPKKFRVIDHPGHRRLAGGLRALLEKEVRGGKRVAVVFVVDGSKAGRDKEIGAVVECVLMSRTIFSLTADERPRNRS
jgi:hypothetical protein